MIDETYSPEVRAVDYSRLLRDRHEDRLAKVIWDIYVVIKCISKDVSHLMRLPIIVNLSMPCLERACIICPCIPSGPGALLSINSLLAFFTSSLIISGPLRFYNSASCSSGGGSGVISSSSIGISNHCGSLLVFDDTSLLSVSEWWLESMVVVDNLLCHVWYWKTNENP